VGGMFWDLVSAELYAPGHPYAPREEKGCILRCELRHVQWLMQRGYRPDNARLVLVGDFDAALMLTTVERLFGSIENPDVRLPPPREPRARSGKRRITIAAPVPRPRLHLYWDAPRASRQRFFPLHVLRAELERLLEAELVTRRGLGTGARMSLVELELGSLWSAEVDLLPGVDPELVERLALAEVDGVRRRVASASAARQLTATNFLEIWDDLDARASLLAEDWAFGFDVAKAIREIDAVSDDELTRLAAQALPAAPRLSVHVRRAVDAPTRGELYRQGE
jgi:hypothetical protein